MTVRNRFSWGEEKRSFCKNYRENSIALYLKEKEKNVFPLYIGQEEDQFTYD